MTTAAAADKALIDKLNAAVAEHNAAEQAVTTAQAELVSKSKAVGLLLLEAKTRHPKAKDFEAFLKRVNGLGISRAYDCMRIAGGRTTDEELRREARERVRKHRANKKIPKPDSVTPPRCNGISQADAGADFRDQAPCHGIPGDTPRATKARECQPRHDRSREVKAKSGMVRRGLPRIPAEHHGRNAPRGSPPARR